MQVIQYVCLMSKRLPDKKIRDKLDVETLNFLLGEKCPVSFFVKFNLLKNTNLLKIELS